MSFRAVTETVVHFESFRNIDLFHQGIYFLRTSLYYQKDNNFYYAQPYTIFNAKLTLANQFGGQGQSKRKKRNLDHHNIIPANIDKNLFTFNTRAFMIRYCEEEVELNDIGHFRVELDLEQSLPSSIEFYMEIELMFSDLLNQGGPEKFQQSNNLKDIEGNVEFKCVSVQKFKIKKLCDGVFEYIPVVFDESHFCVALCTFHSSLLDFRFRSRPLKPFSRVEYQKNVQLSEQNNNNNNNKGGVEDKKNKLLQDTNKINEMKSTNIAEYLFSNDRGEIADDIDSTEIDLIYNGYMQALIGSYEKLKGKFNTFAAKCLSERQKRESGLILVAPPLVLPSEKEFEQENQENMNLIGGIGKAQEEEKEEKFKGMSKPPMSGIGQNNNNNDGTGGNSARMGGRIGVKMEKVMKKDEDNGPASYMSKGIGGNHELQMKGEEESVVADYDDPIDDDFEGSIPNNNINANNGRKQSKTIKNFVQREPEREPDMSYLEGNVSQSVDMGDKANGGGGMQRQIHQSNIPTASKQAPQKPQQLYEEEDHAGGGEEEAFFNISHEASLNISETNESMLELKKVTAIPVIKNYDKFKGKSNQGGQEEGLKQSGGLLNFSSRVVTSDPYQIAFQLVQDINLVSSQVFQLWHKLIEIITINPKFVCEFLRLNFEEKMRESWGEHIYRTIIETKDFAYPSEENVGEIHKQIALKRRNGPNGTLVNSNIDQFNIIEIGSQSLQNGSSGGTAIDGSKGKQDNNPNGISNNQALQRALNDLQPILFEECYVKSLEKIKQMQVEAQSTPYNEYNYKGVHLFVMVHGFQGNACDMRLLKNNIALLFPEAMFLCSNANEDFTEGDISEMGVRLSQEVNSYISQYCPGTSLGKISFIAHSLGGLIVRAALPYLEEHSEKMYNYFTLSSPHLGYMYNSSKIVDAGMWLLKTWRKSKCLQQLRMSDNKNLEESFLYKLSEMKGLNWFKHIVLVSSYQDSYAPFDSARIQICNKAENDANKGGIYIKMARNILSNLPLDVLYRIDVDFRISEKNLDSLIGRTAHIQFLECQNVMKMLIYRFKEFFC